MKAEILVNKKLTFDVKYLKIKAGVRYWEDGKVNDIVDSSGDLIPCREGNYWCPTIDLDNGQIINWEKGKTAKVHYKVCDDIDCELLTESRFLIGRMENMIPDCICDSCDYIVLNINENGFIENWNNSSIEDEYWQMVNLKMFQSE